MREKYRTAVTLKPELGSHMYGNGSVPKRILATIMQRFQGNYCGMWPGQENRNSAVSANKIARITNYGYSRYSDTTCAQRTPAKLFGHRQGHRPSDIAVNDISNVYF